MKLTTIKVAVLGEPPPGFDARRLARWRSRVFRIASDIERFQLPDNARGDNWEFTDEQLIHHLNQIDRRADEEILLVILNVKLEEDWYVRPLSGNRVLLTFHAVGFVLQFFNIPLNNLVLRVLYAVALLRRRPDGQLPTADQLSRYVHDETRGCLFDMNPFKVDVVASCDRPRVCDFCVAELRKAFVSNEVISLVQDEISKVKKPLFYRVADFVRQHPVWSMIISLVTALLIGIVSSVVGAYFYAFFARLT